MYTCLMIRYRFLISLMLFCCFGLLCSCSEKEIEQSPSVPAMNAPADVQWLRLSQLDQLVGAVDYFSPLPLEMAVLDSFSVSKFEMRIRINDEPGYSVAQNLKYILKDGQISNLAEQIYYNHLLVDKRKFNYTNTNPYAAPFVLNQMKTSNPLIRQLFGLANAVVYMLEISEFQYEALNDSLIVRKTVDPNRKNKMYNRYYFKDMEVFVDTFHVGQLLHVGLPFDWNDVMVKVPFFNWVYIQRHVYHANQMPKKSMILQYGNSIQRTYLYDELGRFEKAIDSTFFANQFVRVSFVSSSYDSLSRPSSLKIYTHNVDGQEVLQRTVAFDW